MRAHTVTEAATAVDRERTALARCFIDARGSHWTGASSALRPEIGSIEEIDDVGSLGQCYLPRRSGGEFCSESCLPIFFNFLSNRRTHIVHLCILHCATRHTYCCSQCTHTSFLLFPPPPQHTTKAHSSRPLVDDHRRLDQQQHQQIALIAFSPHAWLRSCRGLSSHSGQSS